MRGSSRGLVSNEEEKQVWTYGQIVDVSTIDEHVSFVTERREETGEGHRSSNVTPGVSARVNVHSRVSDVGSVAEVRQPPIQDKEYAIRTRTLRRRRTEVAYMSSMLVS
jgi:hypothetical protein